MPRMNNRARVPPWLVRLVYGGLGAVVVGLATLAVGLAQGWADPPRAGPLRWQNDFKSGAGGWEFLAPADGSFGPRDGALVAAFTGDAPGAWAVGLAPLSTSPTGDFTLEVAGASVTPGSGTAYGLVFGWHDEQHYSALLINAGGYAQAYRQNGNRRDEWFAWQQWPHILFGTENNRLRVDQRGTALILRVNDEVVAQVIGGVPGGRVGVAALTAAAPGPAGEVVFSWARLWAEAER